MRILRLVVVLVFFFVFHPPSFFAEREGQRRKLTEKNISLQLVKRARTLQAMEIKKGKEKKTIKKYLTVCLLHLLEYAAQAKTNKNKQREKKHRDKR